MRGRTVPAASLAALAESGLLYLPVMLVVVGEGGASAGPLATYPVFVALFTASVAMAAAFRHTPMMPTVAAAAAVALGLAQAQLWGDAGLAGTGVLVIVALLVAFRAVVLGHRDWRDPVAESFALGTLVLLAEVVVGTAGEGSEWNPYLVAVVVVFFVGSLGSRAASVWSGRLGAIPDEGSGRRLRSAFVLLGGFGGALLVATVLGRPHGLLARVGGFALFVLGEIVYGMAFVAARLVAGPIDWVVDRLDIDLALVSEVARTLEGFLRRGNPAATPGSSPLLRVLGLAVLVAIGLLLVRAIRRFRELAGATEPSVKARDSESSTGLAGPRRRSRRRRPRSRRELPADTVRRWYAEALLAIEQLGVPKPPSGTPGEYLRTVSSAFPECAAGFTTLTRAYEDVRYGGKLLPAPVIDQLEASRQATMAALRRAKPIEEEEA